jgi:hypothetical protein
MANSNGHVYEYPDDGAGSGGGGQQGAGQQGQQGQQGGGQQGGQPAFADAGSARTFLSEYVNDADFLKAVPDEKVVPWAGHVKSKVDGFSKQFPGEWRKLVAGDNAEHLKTLERFQSPKALYESYAALRSKMSAGELKAITPFPEKGTPEQQAAWRAENGVPVEPVGEKGYQFKLDPGVTLGERDKAEIEELKKAAHAAHMPPSQFQSVVDFYFDSKDRQTEARRKGDNEFRLASEDTLRAEWGQEYRGHVNRINAFLDTAPKGVKQKINGARGPDGKPLGSDPDVLKWLLDQALQANPAGVVLPGAGGNIASSIEDEITKIEKVMRENRSAYDKDEKMQARWRELDAARTKMKQKKAA